MLSTLRPRALRAGDVVAVAVLSGGLLASEAAQFERGVAVIEEMGFTVRVSPLVGLDRRWRWAAARPEELADEFNGLLRDPEVRAVFALTGGRAALSYLDLIDYDAVAADPKPVLGFSDISTLHLALHSRTGLTAVHGDLVTHGFGDRHTADEDRRTRLADVYRSVLTGDRTTVPLPAGGAWECWRPGCAEGPLIGGMLNRLIRIQATSYALDPERFDGAILFWEEAGASTSAVWNDLHLLRQAGVLDRIAGMVVGPADRVDAGPDGTDPLRDIVLDVVGDRDIPVLGNADIGHNPPNVPLPLGVRAALGADAGTLTLTEAAVAAPDGA
jgi:muramoyltetrapeptide carboxypeptidase